MNSISDNVIHQENERPSASVLPTLPSSQPINIWLVDDNKEIRAVMMDLLNGFEGIKCRAAFSSPNAVLSTLASKPGPDIILLDVQMGEACGLDAIRPIKALSRSTQILMFTTCADFESQRRAMASGASGFLLKHFSAEQILDSIQHASQNPAPHPKHLRKPQPSQYNTAPCTPARKSHWFWQWLDFMHPRRN